jgi:hypothetical protein
MVSGSNVDIAVSIVTDVGEVTKLKCHQNIARVCKSQCVETETA